MNTAEKTVITSVIKAKVSELGFDLCGIARVRSLREREPILKSWVEAGMNDKMDYLREGTDKRLNPAILFPGARSMVVTGLNYFAEPGQKKADVPIISRYTYGADYHDIIIPRLRTLLDHIKTVVPEAEGKPMCDSGPVHEKAWASEAGLGWQGRHSILINKEIGSFIFIGILILNIELDYNTPFTGELCGSCTLCVDACPTGAINDNRTIDTRKCISNLTIDKRGAIPPEIVPNMGRRIYGCDRCQEVCPWNKNAKPNKTPEFAIPGEVAEMDRNDWLSLTEEEFRKLFKKSPIGRKKFTQLKENIRIVLK